LLAVTMISTSMYGRHSSAPTHARTGGFAASTHSFQAALWFGEQFHVREPHLGGEQLRLVGSCRMQQAVDAFQDLRGLRLYIANRILPSRR
jgi:hypothetical protein